MMLTNPIIVTIALVEFCSGFIRQAPMQWYRTFAKQTDVALSLKGDIIYENWGVALCIAGITGGVNAGIGVDVDADVDIDVASASTSTSHRRRRR